MKRNLPAIPLKRFETLEAFIWFHGYELPRQGFKIQWKGFRKEGKLKYISGVDPYK